MLLEHKHAVVYGAGDIGSAVARAFAREGAKVHLAGRTREKLQPLAEEIGADTATVDVTDPASVDRFADALERIDISFNLVGADDVQGTPLVEMDVDPFMQPIVKLVRSQFLTAKAAARSMIRSGEGGVILFFGGSGEPLRDYSIGGFQIGLEAVEALRRQLASELGKHRIRTVTLRTGGVIDSIPPDFEGADALVASLEAMTLTGRGARLQDVGDVAAFVASDKARTMTAATVNVSAGALID
jgi:NAD(P)-dependent dehydrogenase (short-subunit alcohol dehydrogenase family)